MASVNEVFGLTRDIPISYVERQADKDLVIELQSNNPILIFGHVATGKTMLYRRHLDGVAHIYVRCPAHDSISSIRSFLVAALRPKETQVDTEATANIDVFFTEAEWKRIERNRDTHSPETSSDALANFLGQTLKDTVVVFDDIHAIEPAERTALFNLIRAASERIKIVSVAAHGTADVYLNNASLGIRTKPIDASKWSDIDLFRVLEKGSEALNVSFNADFCAKLVDLSGGSIITLQDCVRTYLAAEGIERKQRRFPLTTVRVLGSKEQAEAIAQYNVSRGVGPAFEAALKNFAAEEGREHFMRKLLLEALLRMPIDALRDGVALGRIAAETEARKIDRRIDMKTKIVPSYEPLQNALRSLAEHKVGTQQALKLFSYSDLTKQLELSERRLFTWLATRSPQQIDSLIENLYQ